MRPPLGPIERTAVYSGSVSKGRRWLSWLHEANNTVRTPSATGGMPRYIERTLKPIGVRSNLRGVGVVAQNRRCAQKRAVLLHGLYDAASGDAGYLYVGRSFRIRPRLSR